MPLSHSRRIAKQLTCPTCGLHSIWNLRVDGKLTKDAKTYLEHCEVKGG